jgi:transposase
MAWVAQGGFSLSTEEGWMFAYIFHPRLSEFDLEVFDAFVPPDHFLRQALVVIPWDDLDDLLSGYYSPDMGRPPESPTLMFKLQYLCYHCRLSDRQVIERSKTDIAFRFFLQVDVNNLLPDPSSLSRFRGRLTKDGFRSVFDKIVATAREHGLVRDRLRLKDASHVIANIAIPSGLGLVAQTRDNLLAAAAPFDPIRVEGERINIDLLRESTKGQSNEARLEARATHLQEMLAWIDELPSPEDAATNRDWQELVECRKLAHKILNDQENPTGKDKTRSTVDIEARRGKHGDWYDGYLVDILVDPHSEIITQINVMPANGAEAADAIALLTQEEEAHGNDVDTLSIDGAGFNGPVLRELEDPEGLNVDVIVPPKAEPTRGLFTPGDFAEDTEQGVVTCRAGETSRYRQRDSKQRTTIYRFTAETCQGCPLLNACMANAPKKFGRSVRKNDYQAEYDRVRQKATTDRYAEVRKEHPKVERKLGEMLNCHGGRRARYRGVAKVTVQELLAATATNVKRIVRLVCAPTLCLEPQA